MTKTSPLTKSAEETAKIDNRRRQVAAVGGQGWAELQEERAILRRARRVKITLWVIAGLLVVAALFGIT